MKGGADAAVPHQRALSGITMHRPVHGRVV